MSWQQPPYGPPGYPQGQGHGAPIPAPRRAEVFNPSGALIALGLAGLVVLAIGGGAVLLALAGQRHEDEVEAPAAAAWRAMAAERAACANPTYSQACAPVAAFLAQHLNSRLAHDAQRLLNRAEPALAACREDEEWASFDGKYTCKAPRTHDNCEALEWYLLEHGRGRHEAEARAILQQAGPAPLGDPCPGCGRGHGHGHGGHGRKKRK